MRRISIGKLCLLAIISLFAVPSAWAREIKYTGNEQNIFVNPGEPTQIVFPSKIEGGFKRKNSALALERNGNFLVLFAQPDLTDEGEALLVLLDDKRSYAIRVLPGTDDHPRDESVRITDEREDTDYENGPQNPDLVPRDGFAPPTLPSGLIREMILVAEMGKKKGIAGYRRSNRYTGETVLHDGAIEAKIDEIFMGPDYWGYVLTVENLLDTTQKLNPATFRLDGTRAVSAERWELAARPDTAEQKLAAAHQAKVYIVTRALKH
ncbi:MAG: hypothetical protein U0136_16940 [Bdellovibrionota bacterium]